MRLGFVCADLSAIIYFVRAILVQLNSNLFFFFQEQTRVIPIPAHMEENVNKQRTASLVTAPLGGWVNYVRVRDWKHSNV